MISRPVHLAATVLAMALVSSLATAQPPAEGRGQAASPPQNLQVLATDTPPEQLQQVMLDVSAALGVQCGFCHVQIAAAAGGRGGRGGGGAVAFDFASDDKPQKKTAREMMLMVRDLNRRVVTAIARPEDTVARVGCVTCHRGVAAPRQLADILDQTTGSTGTPAAIAEYKDLRARYFGAQAYDFSEGALIAYAQRAMLANRPEDAIAWLQTNLEYFPLSSRTYAGLAQAQQRRNDREAAIKSLERAVELDPQNAQLARQLAQLKGQ